MKLEQFYNEWNSDSAVMELHTSGSTAEPKTIFALKRRMLASAAMTCGFLGLNKGDRALLCMPLDYIAGKMMVVRSIHAGLKLLCVEPSNHPFASLPNDQAPFDFVAMVPSQVYCSLNVEREAAILRSVRHLLIGGGAISKELERMVRDFPNAVWSTYGMTETLSHIAMRRLSGEHASEWYEAMAGVRLSVDEESCLLIEAPELTDGQLKTNDVVEFEPGSGFRRFKILGRKDNVICSGGIKLQMEKIEEELGEHLHMPFCISKMPDPKWGEIAVLLVQRRCDLSDVELETECNEALKFLESHSRPKKIIVVDSIPLTGNGKIDRKAAADKCSQNA